MRSTRLRQVTVFVAVLLILTAVLAAFLRAPEFRARRHEPTIPPGGLVAMESCFRGCATAEGDDPRRKASPIL